MKRQRPTVVTVFAILNIVVGWFSFVWFSCVGLGTLAFFALTAGRTVPAWKPLAKLSSELSAWDEILPSYNYFMAGSAIVGLVTAIVLVVAAIGLLRMKTWGRWGSVIYAGITIMRGIIFVFYLVVYLNPAMEQWKGDLTREGRPSWIAFHALLWTAYAIALLIAMLHPSVSAAFSRPGFNAENSARGR